MANRVRAHVDLEGAIKSLLQATLYTLGVRRGNVMLINPDTGKLRMKFAQGYKYPVADDVHLQKRQEVADWVVENQKRLLIPSVQEDPLFKNIGANIIESIISIPLNVRGEVVGVLNLDNLLGEGPFTPEDLEQAVLFGERIEALLVQVSSTKFAEIVQENNISYYEPFHLKNIVANDEDIQIGEVFKQLAQETFTQADSGMIFLFDKESSQYKLEGYFGLTEEQLFHLMLHFNVEDCHSELGDEPIIIKDWEKQKLACLAGVENISARSLMIAPLLSRDRGGVVFICSNSPNSFEGQHMQLFYLGATLVGMLQDVNLKYQYFKAKSKRIIDSFTSGIICTDLQGRITVVNKWAEEILGLEESDLKNKSVLELEDVLEIINKNKLEEVIEQLIVKGSLRKFSTEVKVRLKNGEDVVLTLNINMLRNSQDKPLGFVAVFDDVTEQLKLEDKLREAERLSIAGQLASGVAHEIRNPLASIRGFAQLLQDRVEGQTESQFTGMILKEVEQLNRIVKQMESLKNESMSNLEWIDLEQVIVSALNCVKNHDFVHYGKITTNIAGGIPPVLGSREELEQAFCHIIKNGLEFTPACGAFWITVTMEESDVVKIDFADTGFGINEEDKRQIFNPFFTSRPERTGLGLAISYKIIRDHGGIIEVESVKGEGTTISIKLPINFQFNSILEPPPSWQHC
ncbi:PAS domain S-box-containing protein [Desulfitispora alkaliphila]|uniref:ATP-binding protein n=1 Tax=Desulfitispora alkaliphila TaxID=622674 RepID=UPI003D1EF066